MGKKVWIGSILAFVVALAVVVNNFFLFRNELNDQLFLYSNRFGSNTWIMNKKT